MCIVGSVPAGMNCSIFALFCCIIYFLIFWRTELIFMTRLVIKFMWWVNVDYLPGSSFRWQSLYPWTMPQLWRVHFSPTIRQCVWCCCYRCYAIQTTATVQYFCVPMSSRLHRFISCIYYIIIIFIIIFMNDNLCSAVCTRVLQGRLQNKIYNMQYVHFINLFV